MDYILEFSIVSAAYLAVTAIFYCRQRKVPSARNTLFAVLLFLGGFFAVIDVLVVVVESFTTDSPVWLFYVMNIIFLLSIQLSGALFYIYCKTLTDLYKNTSHLRKILSCVPFLIVMTLLCLSPFMDNGIFFIDQNNIYRRGMIYPVLYVNIALYLIASFVLIFRSRRKLRARKVWCVFAFLFILFISMAIQFLFPKILMNAMANALALILIYHVLEAPSTHIDALTGMFNCAALPLILQDSFEQDKRSTLLVFPLHSLQLINYSMGADNCDRLLCRFSDYLRQTYTKSHIFRVSNDTFAVLTVGGKYCDFDRLCALYSRIPTSFSVNGLDIRLKASLVGMNSENFKNPSEVLAICGNILHIHREEDLDEVILVDDEYKQLLSRESDMADAVDSAIENDRVEMYYQPIHDKNGKLCALESLVRIRDESGALLPTQEAVEISEKFGSIYRLQERIIRLVCDFIKRNDAGRWSLHHIGINLSALQFMDDALPETILGIMNEYGIERSIIAFEITETASVSISYLRNSMNRMSENGFYFLLDDFGKGYANLNQIAQLPLLCVKIDKDILWEAKDSIERMALLTGIAGMLKKLDLDSVCEGVETKEQVELLRKLGVDMLQGYYYSKPISERDLLEYIQKEAKA